MEYMLNLKTPRVLPWLVALVVACASCASVQGQVRNLQSCSAVDAKVITDGTAAIVLAVSTAKRDGTLVTSMLTIIDAMARVNAAWKSCKANTHESRALGDARGDGDIDVATLAELLGSG